jgi:NAD-dependent epimerase/dehydratase
MKNILIFGGSGFIGSFLSKRLCNQYNVFIYDINEPIFQGKFTFIKGNFSEDLNFFDILTSNKIDVVFHMISTTIPEEGTKNIEKEIIMNVLPSIRLFNSMVSLNIKKLIFLSSGGAVYGEYNGIPHKTSDLLKPICSYGIQKKTIEDYIELFNLYYDMEFTIVRVANPYGVWEQEGRVQGVIPIFINNILKEKEVTIYGETVRDYIYIDDLIDALEILIEYKGKERIFNIGTGIGHSISEIIKIIEDSTSRKFKNKFILDIRKCDVKENILDISKTCSELDWTPNWINICDGINFIINKLLNINL